MDGIATILPFHRRLLAEPAFVAENGVYGVDTGWVDSECTWLPELVEPLGTPDSGELTSTWIEIDGRRHTLRFPQDMTAVTYSPEVGAMPSVNENSLISEVVGTLTRWLIASDANVRSGEIVATVEAIKMETSITAHKSGILHPLVVAGNEVTTQTVLAHID